MLILSKLPEILLLILSTEPVAWAAESSKPAAKLMPGSDHGKTARVNSGGGMSASAQASGPSATSAVITSLSGTSI
jgi:hypothetical protein